MDVEAYLRRINDDGPRQVSLDVLRRLHVAHLQAVPFENLDIHLGSVISLDERSLFDKIVRRRRGGFCYELNGLFASLLRALGFQVTLIAGRVAREDGLFGPEFDHLALVVELDGPFLVDVGLGRGFREPLRIDVRHEQLQHGRSYRIDIDGAGEHNTVRERTTPTAPWSTRYIFTLTPREMADFAATCLYHQTSSESNFTQQRTCTIATPSGRVSLIDNHLKITEGRRRIERTVADGEEYRQALRDHFGIEL